jgi:hypothetical protein
VDDDLAIWRAHRNGGRALAAHHHALDDRLPTIIELRHPLALALCSVVKVYSPYLDLILRPSAACDATLYYDTAMI